MKPANADIADSTALLRSAGWLATTAPDFQEATLARCRWQFFAAGETITHGGDVSGGMVAIARGAVSLLPSVGAADAPLIHVATAPFWYGSNPVVRGEPRSVSVIARTQTLIAQVPQHAIVALLAENPERWRFITLQVCEILTLTSQIATDLLIRDSRRRCIAVLLRLAGRRASGENAATTDVGQDELAAMANMSRQTIGPILHALAADGFVTAGYRSITLNDPAALRAIVEG